MMQDTSSLVPTKQASKLDRNKIRLAEVVESLQQGTSEHSEHDFFWRIDFPAVT